MVKLEVMDEQLHRALHLAAARRRDLVVFGKHRALPFRRVHFLHALLHDAGRLAHLFHADAIAVVAVAVLAHRNIEIHLGVALVGLRLAQIPHRAGAAHHHAGKSPRPTRPRASPRRYRRPALLEDAILGEQFLEIVAHFQERIRRRRRCRRRVSAADPGARRRCENKPRACASRRRARRSPSASRAPRSPRAEVSAHRRPSPAS